MSALLSTTIAPILIRYNHTLATRLLRQYPEGKEPDVQASILDGTASLEDHVIICGYGRVGHTIATLLVASEVPFVAYDTNLARIAQGRSDGHRVLYGDISDAGLFASGNAERAALILITIDDAEIALQAVSFLRSTYPGVPIIARARDLEQSARLLEAGATQAHPEAVEASLRLGAATLEMEGASHENTETLDTRCKG